MDAPDFDTFLVSFEGQLVETHSLDDALAIKAAGHILNNEMPRHHSPREMEVAAAALARYGFEQASRDLASIARRLRSAQFLCDALGHQRPRNVR
jgi:hypothetical protein